MKIAITTLYTPEIESFSVEAVKNFRMYSDLHGYDLFVYEDTLVDGLRGNWCKPKVLLNHIDQYDYVVWLDSDIAIIDMDRPLEDIIKPHEDKLFISTNDMGGWKLCNGFMIFKNTKKAKDILNLLWGQQRKMQSKGRGDQRFFIDFIDKINLPEKTYHLYPQSQICAPLFLKNEKSFSVHVMGIHIDDVRKKYIQHINEGFAKPISKNKNVIYVVNAYDDYQMPDIWQYTKPTILSYAEKYNVDFVELKPSDLNKHVNRAYFKIDAIDEFVKSDYENAVIMDNDIAISNLSPDIFKECNKGVWALDISKTHKGMFEYFNTTFHDKFYPNKQKPKFSINSGLVVLDKLSAKKIQNTRPNLHSPEQISKTRVFKRDRTFTWEQEYFTYLINESNVEFNLLNYKFNFLGYYLQSMPTKDWDPELAPFYFLHMVGNSKKIGLRCLREYRNCFDQIPEPPFEELPRDSSHLQDKHKDMIALKDKWENFLNADWLKFIDANLSHKQPMTGKYSCFNAGKKIGIVSLYTKEISDYAVYSENSIKEYALKNGYTFHVYRDSIDKNSHPNWSKPQALLNHIDDHEWIVWMDSDTLIFNDERKLESIISQCTPNKKTIACEDVGSRNEKMQKGSMFNSGVLFFASHAYSKNIINEWNDYECDKSSLYSGGGDQNVLCDIIRRKDIVKANIKIFPMNEFNTEPRMVDEKTFILHFMAYPQHFKKIFMKYWDSK